MVLFLFIIMLMNLNADTEPQKHIATRAIAGVVGGVLLFVMVGALKGAEQLQLGTRWCFSNGISKEFR